MDINDIYQSNSDYLKADDIGQSMPTYTMSTYNVKDFDNGDKKLVVDLVEVEKSLVLNKTNAHAIGDAYGTNPQMWNGKQIMLFTMPVDFQGKQVQAIRVRMPVQQSPNQPNNNGFSENPNPNG